MSGLVASPVPGGGTAALRVAAGAIKTATTGNLWAAAADGSRAVDLVLAPKARTGGTLTLHDLATGSNRKLTKLASAHLLAQMALSGIDSSGSRPGGTTRRHPARTPRTAPISASHSFGGSHPWPCRLARARSSPAERTSVWTTSGSAKTSARRSSRSTATASLIRWSRRRPGSLFRTAWSCATCRPAPTSNRSRLMARSRTCMSAATPSPIARTSMTARVGFRPWCGPMIVLVGQDRGRRRRRSRPDRPRWRAAGGVVEGADAGNIRTSRRDRRGGHRSSGA